MADKRQADQVSINIFEVIDSICADFRRCWRNGERPRIEDFLGQVPESARSNLFRNLLQLDVRYHGQQNGPLTSEEYHKRFPEFGSSIRQVFNEPTLVSMEAMHSTPADDSYSVNVALEMPAANRLGE